MLKLYKTLLLCFITALSYAQEAQIRGTISEKENNAVVSYIPVQLFENDKFIKGVVSGQNGDYNFDKLSKGTYTIKVSGVGYELFQTEKISIVSKNQHAELNMTLLPMVSQLSEVIVKGDIGVTKIEPGKIVYKASDLPVAKGSSVGDMLRLMPSVAMGGPPGVPRDIRYRGLEKSYTLVLIDGKNAGMTGNNREVVLNQIPVSAIERIEIIASPGAQYDGDGMNGVVNIILKKNARYGTHGQIMAGINSLGGYNASVQASHKVKSAEFYGAYDRNLVALTDGNSMTETNKVTLLKNGEVSGYQDIFSKESRKITSDNIKLGTRWNLWKGADLRAEYVRGWQKEEKIKTQDTRVLKADQSFGSRTLRTEDQTEDWSFNEYIVQFSQKLSANGKLSLSYNHVDGHYPKPKYQTDQKLNAAGAPLDSKPALTNTFENNYDRNDFIQADYSLRSNHIFTFNSGLKYSGRNRENIQIVDKFDYNKNQFVTSQSPTNNFSSSEKILAGYTQAVMTRGRLRSEIGIRGEYTHFYNETIEPGYSTKGNYFIPLPSASFIYNLDTTQFLKFSVDRKIRRASFKDLSPFVDSSDVAKIKTGNPLLRPEKAWGFELGYMKTSSKWNIGVNLFRRQISGLIQKVLYDVSDGVVLEKPDNFNSAYIQGVELIGAAQPLPFWSINGSYSRFGSKLKNEDQGGGDAIKDQFNWCAKMISDFTLGKNTFFQVAWNGIGPKVSSQKEEQTLAYWDASISQYLVKKKMMLSVRLMDIFNTNNKQTIEYTTAQTSAKVQDIPGRQVFINLSYSF
ncbi:TonB-dependent receptor [Dyadobacter psychrotolerans]|uniref:TonB-dependent receptor n=1 Tax=Dyadobacter psychrotolerans TaxID=2541721 RepID=A0A4R5DXS6_9BACT|nr:outer membrane beta-barrel family protein [Dyadobacter psychrotolerans]TDE17280.1 TonB-dependent receptor [Dyadobacter psychrotolerans]